MGKLILVTGGTRSGKSGYAQDLAESMAGPRYFVATCPKIDQEMDARIKRHQQMREQEDWLTIEEERDLNGVFDRMEGANVCLIDCLTLWVNNLLFHKERSQENLTENILQKYCREFIHGAQRFPGTTICVTGEVGMGIVPENAGARFYRDLVGCCNQIIARAADRVVLVSCGIPLELK
jgi:adenosylcobinamide kinase / adenosylcobinamide-phosphate guanylyltransferase